MAYARGHRTAPRRAAPRRTAPPPRSNLNTGFACNQPPVSTIHFVIGDFIVVDPHTPLRFDENMTLKEGQWPVLYGCCMGEVCQAASACVRTWRRR
jgi:hypothetical protein